MHRFKRTLVWLLVAVLLGSAFPFGISQQASAASAATYFIPDIKTLRQTATLTTDGIGGTSIISRDNVYLTNDKTLTIAGAFSYVTASSMAVKVEMLSAAATGAGGIKWVTDSTHVTNGVVTLENGSTNRFTANDLPLYTGFNKITFTGMQGSVERSDVFYVLYDSVPYIQNLKVIGDSTGAINLNEGSRIVVDKQKVTLQGVAQNATKVTVSLNGSTPIITSLIDNGTFYSSSLTLASGVNTINLVISNTSDSVNVSRELYFYDPTQPFTQMNISQQSFASGGEVHSLFETNPTLSDGQDSYYLQGQILLPYNDADISTVVLTVDGVNYARTINTADVETVTATDGATPVYRLVTFKSDGAIPMKTDTAGTVLTNQTPNFGITYNGITYTFKGKFKYLPHNFVISNMYYLPDLKTSGTTPTSDDFQEASREPLNGQTVTTPDFYILVQTSKKPDSTVELKGAYLPLATNSLNLTPVAAWPDDTSGPYYQVYKVTGFLSGSQQVKFNYDGSVAAYNAAINYASKSYIYIDNLYDGQSYTFDSRVDSTLAISGKFIGFNNLESTQFFVNGTIPMDGLTPIDLGLPPSTPPATPTDEYSFNVTLKITATGPLVYGQNTLTFKGVNLTSSGKTEITKTIRIYIIDKNVSTIDQFHPAAIPTNGRVPFPDPQLDGIYDIADFTDSDLAKILGLSTNFTYKGDGVYETSDTSYDLVLRGSGAKLLNLYLGSDLFFQISDIPESGDPINGNNVVHSYNGITYQYDFAGGQDDFIVRLKGLTFGDLDKMIFNLELVNETGARTTQKLEIDRIIAPYRIVSPQPSVGDQIIVNKNFVHFDIEAEGATKVVVDKGTAVQRKDMNNRFVYDYVGLKANKWNAIKVQITRSSGTVSATVNVYYTDTVQTDTQYMAPIASKLSVFNKGIQLTFPKGTVLEAAVANSQGVKKFYTDTNLLFGIADPKDGVVERRNDYGNIINQDEDERTNAGQNVVRIPDYLVTRFLSSTNTSNFTRISQIYWINGGYGELGNPSDADYLPATNGMAPYSYEGNFLEILQNNPERKVVPSNRGSLTLAYNSSVVAEAGSTLTVFRYTESGQWENVGGVVDTKNHTITVPFDDFGYYMVSKLSKSFNDITNHLWARNILNALYAKGIMANTGVSTFGTDDTTTRGEFATLLVKGLNIPLNYDDNATFYDVLPDTSTATWDYKSIETAARAGIINGLSEGFFSPDGKLSREEAAVMIARAMQLTLAANTDKLANTLSGLFLDSASVSYYARPAVVAINQAKIMTGSPAPSSAASSGKSTKSQFNFNPKSYLTRAEAGKIAIALLQKSTKTFPANLS